MPRTLNAATLALNASTEQLRLIPYDDKRPNYVLKPGDKILGTLTVGLGHTGPDVVIGVPWTIEQAYAARIVDLTKAEDAVQAALDEGGVTMGDNRLGSTADFVYNIGTGNFEHSTVRKLIVAGNLAAVPAEFNRWIYSKGQKMAGLVTRRAKEALLYNTPDATPIALPAACEPSITPDAVDAPRVWSAKPVIAACVAGVSTVCGYAPQISDSLNNAAGQLAPLVEYGHSLKVAFLACSLGGIVVGGVSSFMHHKKDASQ